MKDVTFIKLVNNLKAGTIIPRRFDLWSRTLQLAWLRQHQVQKVKK